MDLHPTRNDMAKKKRAILCDLLNARAASTAEWSHHASGVRKAIQASDELGDAGTADLFTGVSRAADKVLWLVEAHLQAES